MKKLLVFLFLWLGSIVFSWCGKNQSSAATQNVSADVTKNECMVGCKMLRTSNGWNKDRSTADMNKDCNNLCDAAQGMQNNDASACEKSEWILRDTCYSDIAKKTKDATLCEKVSGKLFINSCYSSVAEELQDASLCDKIADQIFKEICLEKIKK